LSAPKVRQRGTDPITVFLQKPDRRVTGVAKETSYFPESVVVVNVEILKERQFMAVALDAGALVPAFQTDRATTGLATQDLMKNLH
jgi:hypothetical protein